MRSGPAVVLLVTTLTVSACKKERVPDPAPVATAWSAIQAEIGDASCDDSTQCRTTLVRPYWPGTYIAWSTKRNGDGKQLAALVARYRAVEIREQQGVDLPGFREDPGATCESQRCVLRP